MIGDAIALLARLAPSLATAAVGRQTQKMGESLLAKKPMDTSEPGRNPQCKRANPLAARLSSILSLSFCLGCSPLTV